MAGATSAIGTGATANAVALAIAADPGTITGATFLTQPSPVTAAVTTASVAGMPLDGTTYGILSTGDAAILDEPNTATSSGTALGGPNVRGDSDLDVTVLAISIQVPTGTNCLVGLDFRFLSEEYPEYVGSSFNDAFIAELDATTWTTTGSTISAPGNFAFDPLGNPITINAAGVTSMSAAEATGTTYDGGTPMLRARTPISPGAHTLFLSIFDQGDSILDSAVVIDNLRFGSVADIAQDCTPGATPTGPDASFVVLGDSYASGEGSGNYDTGTDQRKGCHRSPNAWGRQLATDHDGLTILAHIACSGAKTAAFTDSFKGEPPQQTQWTDLINQLENDPDLALVMIGGNDLFFADIMKKCFVDNSLFLGPCVNFIRQQQKRVGSVAERVADVLTNLGEAAPGVTPVLVGYPRLLPDSWDEVDHQVCSWLSHDEWEEMNELVYSVNSAWAAAAVSGASEVNARYIPTAEVLDGHELCTTNLDTWMYPLTAEQNNNQQVHPNAKGQDAIKSRVYTSLGNLHLL